MYSLMMIEICEHLKDLVLSKEKTPAIFQHFTALRGRWSIDTSQVNVTTFKLPNAEDVDGFYFVQETTNWLQETDSLSIGKIGDYYFLLFGCGTCDRPNSPNYSGTFTLSDSLPRLISRLNYSQLVNFRNHLIPDGKRFDSVDLPL